MCKLDFLNKLNQIPVVESSASCGELDYVLIQNTEDNRKVLSEMGMTEAEYNEMTIDDIEDDELLDITFFACEKLGAAGWHGEKGFLTEEQARE